MENLPKEYLKSIPDMELLKDCLASKPETIIALLDAFEQHMTEIEKQCAGQLYDPTDSDICEMRKRGGALVKKFNSFENYTDGMEILKKLFAKVGENVRVNRPFHIDFGCHTSEMMQL